MRILILVISILIITSISNADITFTNGKWENSFECTAVDQKTAPDCNGITGWAGAWAFNKYIITDGVTDNWTQSSVSNEWYYNKTTFDTFNEGFSRDVFVGFDIYKNTGYSPTPIIGSLTAGWWQYGDGDSLGYDTIYIYHTTDPDLETDGQIRAYWLHNPDLTGDYLSTITADANNSEGASGSKGLRTLHGDGRGQDTAPLHVIFPSSQTEVWIRWYARLQFEYDWVPLDYIPPRYLPGGLKMIYMFTDGGNSQYAGFDALDEYDIRAQGTTEEYQVVTTGGNGWTGIMGIPDYTQRQGSDGLWHCYEVHMKMDSALSNGIGQIWIDGVLKASNFSVDWSGAVDDNKTPEQIAAGRLGWDHFHLGENQTRADNRGEIMSIDYDDLTVYNVSPPNTCYDENGLNPFPCIGLYGDTPTPTTSGTIKGATVKRAILK